MASTTHASLAKDAAAYIAGSAGTIQSLSADPEEINRQSVCLIDWSRKRNAILSEAYTSDLEKHGGATAEHEVFYRISDNRAVKRTYAGTFGITNDPKGSQKHATPLFYLRRLELMNRVFSSDLRFEGIILGKSLIIGATGDHPCMVISQPWHRAANENAPHPSDDEVKEFMEALNFREVKGSYYGWIRDRDQIAVGDARRDNFIRTENGVVPIDLVISDQG
jgi:hypothetical protein